VIQSTRLVAAEFRSNKINSMLRKAKARDARWSSQSQASTAR
jgi:hypothetical protein